jgi:hypothetical protein
VALARNNFTNNRQVHFFVVPGVALASGGGLKVAMFLPRS